MYRITVRDKQGVVTHVAEWANQAVAQAWRDEQLALKSWGDPANFDVIEEDITAEVTERTRRETAWRVGQTRLRELARAAKAGPLTAAQINEGVRLLLLREFIEEN